METARQVNTDCCACMEDMQFEDTETLQKCVQDLQTFLQEMET